MSKYKSKPILSKKDSLSPQEKKEEAKFFKVAIIITCLLYTSDAADERSSVDLGGRRIIKKKPRKEHKIRRIIVTKER